MRPVAAALLLLLPPSFAAAQESPARQDPAAVPAPAAAAASAASQPRSGQRGTYVALNVGPVVPVADLRAYDDGLSVGATVGYRASRNVALELGVGRFSLGASGSGNDATRGDFTLEQRLVAYPIFGSVKVVAPVRKVELYGVLGAGVLVLSGEIDETSATYGTRTVSDSDTPFAFQLGGGLTVHVTRRTTIGAELRYVAAWTDLLSASWQVSSTELAGVVFGGTLGFEL